MFQISELLKYDRLLHIFSQKSDGNMANSINGVVYDFPNVIENRRKFFKRIGVDINKTACIWGVHGDNILEPRKDCIGVSMVDYKKAVKCDGLITDKKGVFLFLLIADCIPLIIFDPVKEAIGLIHAGWRGVDLEIAKKGVGKFKLKYKSKTEDIIVAIGPCAQKESFIKDNPEQLNDPRWRDFITPVEYRYPESSTCHPEFISGSKTDKILNQVQHDKCNNFEKLYNIDLVGFTKKQLIDAGIKKKNIIDCGIDTVKDKRFFSHVRDCSNHISRQGRFACVVGLK